MFKCFFHKGLSVKDMNRFYFSLIFQQLSMRLHLLHFPFIGFGIAVPTTLSGHFQSCSEKGSLFFIFFFFFALSKVIFFYRPCGNVQVTEGYVKAFRGQKKILSFIFAGR